MGSLNKLIGNYGEDIAENFLIKSGYEILERNFRCKIGEIDIIGKNDDFICFIEVKTRYSITFGLPCEAVNFSKRNKIYRTAEKYILNKRLFSYNFRFDIVEIYLNSCDDCSSIRLIKNAFQI